ncbi:hypothetical protein SERLA73DRAFT_88352 [Serpula lacrymans var. lacrymans S7.3]|uniref:Uncharacterized protein n=1 Tax=Serpula lacrymans var. lacrymans (strain S7.3) TaxID=936435 RepID=F8PUX5_SERL3|nr:hypothetical protein SERLA73DRAFT_88352 [Serpula lacrymans var. lacrymans S7.3]
MVLSANGLICVGTDMGRIYVFDFKQTLKCICGQDAPALSHDHTFVASGHASGYIQLFDLKNPQQPVRIVAPITLAAVSSGRQEGHLVGSRIVSIGFVSSRHTGLVSADDTGLAFCHSLNKILFIDASDVIRILGNYPNEDVSKSDSTMLPLGSSSLPAHGGISSNNASFGRRRKARTTVLAMAPLPLGTIPHATDTYNIVALLTPTKLVVVGLKPSPKTWLKRMREDEPSARKARFSRRGALAWFPSISSHLSADKVEPVKKKSRNANKADQPVPTTPVLAYSWGRTLYLLRVSETKAKQAIVGTLVFEEAGKWTAGDDISAIQWLNTNQLAVFTLTNLIVYDVHTSKLTEQVQFSAASLVSPSLPYTSNGSIPYYESICDIAHSGRGSLQVGTLLTWADKILSLVEEGDFLSAIELTRSYYIGEAPGNQNGLPEDIRQRKDILGEKMHGLMVASTRYAFSEDRMTDGTHFTPDGRGVDRTSLFEDLVTTCSKACVAMNDFDYLFEDLFQQYDDTGISRIYLQQLEILVLDSTIRSVPPRITQRLVALHEDDGRPDLAERIIWHIDPTCLDIDQAILLCQRHQLWDALIYVYTRALRDYVSPIVQLLGLIRQARKHRKTMDFSDRDSGTGLAIEPVIMNAYKVYPYLANVLSGLTYPSEEPLDFEDAFQAKKDAYTFLFCGRSSVWPLGEGGKLVLTAEEDSGVEPTYPYARLLLQFDAESFLHTLDIAFEDSYHNEPVQSINRLVVVKILMEILSSGSLSRADVTFVNIFIARNVPKYPQYIKVAPSASHEILVTLATQIEPDTREDRQLAAEYLLSVYTPHDSDHILQLFESAGFYRILRTWHRQEHQWAPLLLTYFHDPDLSLTEFFNSIDDVLNTSVHTLKGVLSGEVVAVISDGLQQLMEADVVTTASLIDKHAPELHEQALKTLPEGDDLKRYSYLRHLLGPPDNDRSENDVISRGPGPSLRMNSDLCHLYISLRCQFFPSDVITALEYIPLQLLDWYQVMQICEEKRVYDAVIWAMNQRGDPREAMLKASDFEKVLTLNITRSLVATAEGSLGEVEKHVKALKALGRRGIAICLEHSRTTSPGEVPLEDIWFQLLKSQMNAVQSVSSCCSGDALSEPQDDTARGEMVKSERRTLSTLRSLVKETFEALVSISSTRAVSFPRLFKRLVDPSNLDYGISGTYTEFRTILTGMLESYRSDGDMLVISKHLLERDVFDTVEEFTRERMKGWAPSRNVCSGCRKSLLEGKKVESDVGPPVDVNVHVVVLRTGAIYHSRCSPLDA